jgi:hypothetical protein
MVSATRAPPRLAKSIDEIQRLDQVSRDILLMFAITDLKRKGAVASYRNVIRWFEERKLGDKNTVSRAEDMLTDIGALSTRYVKVGEMNVPELQLSHHFDRMSDVVYEKLHGLPV